MENVVYERISALNEKFKQNDELKDILIKTYLQLVKFSRGNPPKPDMEHANSKNLMA